MTEEQKRELEYQFNYYSFHREMNYKLGYKEDSEKNEAKMLALRNALKVLGYAFRFEDSEIKNNIEYGIYRIVERAIPPKENEK